MQICMSLDFKISNRTIENNNLSNIVDTVGIPLPDKSGTGMMNIYLIVEWSVN